MIVFALVVLGVLLLVLLGLGIYFLVEIGKEPLIRMFILGWAIYAFLLCATVSAVWALAALVF